VNTASKTIEQPGRLLSLDLFRGLVMFLLIAEGAGLYRALLGFEGGGILNLPIIRGMASGSGT
jgi:hypothetical protein